MKRDGFLRAVARTSVAASAAALGVFQISPLAQDTSAQAHLPVLHGNGVADDSEAVQAMTDGRKYVDARDGAVHQQVEILYFRPGAYNIGGRSELAIIKS